MTLVFYDPTRSIGFLSFFYRKYYSFIRCFDLKAKVRKIAVRIIFFLSERSFDHALRLLNDFLTSKNSFRQNFTYS